MTIKPENTAVPYARRASLEDSRWSLGCLFTVLADSRETGGQFGLIESLSPKGAEPPRHIHSREDEAFHLLEGEITFYIGDETYEATPGTFVFAPRGVPHSYTFETAVIRMLVLITPGGFEEFFRPPGLAEPARELTIPPPEGPPDVEAMVAALGEYGIEVVGPPGPPEERSENMTIERERIAQYARRASVEDSVWQRGVLFSFLADSRDTGGRFGFLDIVSRKGAEPPRHIHRREDKAYYVLEGEMTLFVGDETYEATPGTFVFLPRGTPLSLAYETDEIRMLVLVAPGGVEEHFRDPRFSEPARKLALPPPPEEPSDVTGLIADLERRGVEIVGPPGPPQE